MTNVTADICKVGVCILKSRGCLLRTTLLRKQTSKMKNRTHKEIPQMDTVPYLVLWTSKLTSFPVCPGVGITDICTSISYGMPYKWNTRSTSKASQAWKQCSNVIVICYVIIIVIGPPWRPDLLLSSCISWFLWINSIIAFIVTCLLLRQKFVTTIL